MKQNVITLSILMVVGCIILFNLCINGYESRELERCNSLSTGIIITIHNKIKSGSTARIEYAVNNTIYNDVLTIPRDHNHYSGKVIVIRIACNNPKIIRIVDTLTIGQYNNKILNK